MQHRWFNDEWLWAAVLILICLCIWLYIRIRRRDFSPEQQIQRILKPYLVAQSRKVLVPDGIGGLMEIDHLILLRQGFLILQSLPLNGHLFGSDQTAQWTQLTEGRSYPFTNPLHYLQNMQQSLTVLVPQIPVYTHIVFTGRCNFPKDKPARASLINTLEADLSSVFSAKPLPEAVLNEAWETVTESIKLESVG
ncbi:nuclease-like protein [Methylophaga frappieri]|uniref:Nuclease-like protein n=1 Tax=Methylophaga frappieri (strain ATCC BAA-2434 / DSM 25690 / JAM7) TaxID=754477 RepID=I1YLJ5_METFJ|nr:nuclease-related domain-containing protein [Methylophaga frappieri]AFJ03788.1 nuclease-like protein [Methylophaga frappieri]